jgi:predicted O-methyltransferase YrrM
MHTKSTEEKVSKKEKLKRSIRKHPAIFPLAKKAYSFYKKVDYPVSYIRYHYSLARGVPYTGTMFYASFMHEPREPVMKNLLKSEIARDPKNPYKILEIGTWGGASAIMWAKTLVEMGNPGTVFCIDNWRPYPSVELQRMKEGLKNDRIFKLFNHNIKMAGVEDRIVPMRAPSNTFAPLLAPEIFDMVYIDGDHTYNQFKRDVQNYGKCVKIGGIVCGDDLEYYPSEIDLEFTYKNSEDTRDNLTDPKKGITYHPGVVLVVHEMFGDVSMKNGFWAMRRTKDGWEKVTL